MTIARRLLISGRVQGVGYRDWAAREARALGLKGWVRNRRDGRVEALAAGEADAVGAFVERCREGPALARAERVEEVEADEDVASGFEVRRTASPFSP